MSSTTTSSKLSPVILEAMARTLSDHDLLRFMLSSKEALNATLDALSTVEYVNYHDQNFEEEPCISFRMRGDNNRKIALNYITQSNPLFNFVVNFISDHITKVKIGELVEISSWVIKAFMSTRLSELSLGIILPKDVQMILKDALNLTEIRYTSFDIFVANGYTAMQAKKVTIDYINLSELEIVLPKSKIFSFPCLTNVEELIIGEEELFLNNYDRKVSDFRRKYWNRFMKFLKSFPSLKSFEIHLSGSSNYPLDTIEHFVFISGYIRDKLPSNIKGKVYLDILLPPNEWIAFCDALIKSVNGETSVLDFNNAIREGIKNRRFQFEDVRNRSLSHSATFSKQSDPSCKLWVCVRYFAKWNEYDFDAENNEEYEVRNFYQYGVPVDSDDETSEAEPVNSSNDINTESVASQAEIPLDHRENNVQSENALNSYVTTHEDLDPVNCSVFDDDFEPESLDADALNIHTFYDNKICLSSATSDSEESSRIDANETETYDSDDEASTLSNENSNSNDAESKFTKSDNGMLDNLIEKIFKCDGLSNYSLESTQSSLTDDENSAD